MVASDLHLFQSNLIFSNGLKIVTFQPMDKKITVSSILKKQSAKFRQAEFSSH